MTDTTPAALERIMERLKEFSRSWFVLSDERGLASIAMDEAAAVIAALGTERDAMRDALKPFAEVAPVFDKRRGTMPTEGPFQIWSVDGRDYTLSVEMVRTARSTIARTVGEKTP